jgi:ankyrin repeat protein
VDQALRKLIDAAVKGDTAVMSRLLNESPELATRQMKDGATRQNPVDNFVRDAMHYVYTGDTALHLAAGAFQPSAVRLLLDRGASCRVRNRRGAEPLHYAADGNIRDPARQHATIRLLLGAGADVNAIDKSGVAPLHRAVRTRSSEAVRVLIAGGADVRARNGSGSTPLHLAVQNTGRGGSGSDWARDEQRKIIDILLEAGAKPTDRDGKGKTVLDAGSQEWIRARLARTAQSVKPPAAD